MKKTLLAVLLIFAFCSMGAAANENGPDGFRRIKWGDPPSKLGLRVPISETQFSIVYKKSGDKMSIGTANLEGIYYEFLHDRQLMAVYIDVRGSSNSARMRDVMIATYGEPAKNESDNYFWYDDNVSISCEYDSVDNRTFVSLMSRPLIQKESILKKQDTE